MPNIDDLSISVKSNVTSATNSIDKLISKLGALSASLGQVNTSGFSAMASGIRQISSASNSISGNSAKNITELSLAIRKFGGKASTQATANIPQLGNALMQLSNSMASVGGMTFNTEGITNLASAINKLGGVKSSTAVQNIPQLTVALQGMVGSLNQIGTASTSISALGQLASSLSKLGGKTVTNAITNIPQLTNALMQMMSTLSKAPQVSYNVIQLVNSLANLASQGSKVGTASNSLHNGFMRFGKGADHARKKSFSLASAIGKLYASYFLLFRLFRGIGKGIGLASDLTEVQNVVDVSFGQYRDRLEQFADTSIVDYGMSELTAKKIASRYQAMGGAIGFAQGEMADMSIELTKLAADMASFYNVEQDAVAEDLEAIFTGQTRPLREYGLDLTQATLQEWALSQGMEANIATMTQAEKVLLRYNYVLAQTGMAQGDFARTSGTWANQIRILKQQFEALGAIIGQNFIYALKPVVTALNTVMAKLIQFARVVSNSLGKIFGWKYEDTTGGIADDLEFGADAADDLGSGLGGAADKAKKLKQQLQGFDELNVLASNTPSSGGGGGGGALGNTDVSATGGQWVRDNTEKFFESDLDSLYKLGDYIGTTLTNQLRSIDWQEVYQGAKNFGKGLASFLNGLISPELFSATGATIAGALNTAIYTALSFGQTFDFIKFGESIGTGINTFFEDTDFVALGETINVWANGILDAIIEALDTVEWDKVGTAIGDFLKTIEIKDLATKLFNVAQKIITGLGEAFGASFETAPLETAIVTLLGALKLLGVGDALGGAISSSIGTSGLSISVPKIVATVAMLSIIASKADARFEDDGGSNISDILGIAGSGFVVARILGATLPQAIAVIATLVSAKVGGEVGLSLGEILSIKSGDWDLADYYADFKWSDILGYSIDEYKEAMGQYFDEFGDWVDKMVETPAEKAQKSVNWKKYWNNVGKETTKGFNKTLKIAEAFGVDTNKIFNKMHSDGLGIFQSMLEGNGGIFSEMGSDLKSYAQIAYSGVTEKFSNMKNKSGSIASGLKDVMINNFNSMNSSLTNSADNTNNSVTASYGTMSKNLTNSADNTKNLVTTSYGTMSKSLKITSADTTSDIVAKYKAMNTSTTTALGQMEGNSLSKFNNIKNNGINLTGDLVSAALGKFTEFNNGSSNSFTNLQKLITNKMNSSKQVVSKQNWYSPGVNLVEGLKNGISNKWSGGGSSLLQTIINLARSLTSKLREAFGIHSPSREWASVGHYLTQGLEIGTLSEEGHLNKSIIDMGARLTDNFSSSLTLATPSSLSGNYDFGVTSTMAHSFSADTSMTSNIADGVRQGLANSQAEQNALLREQNELLMQILEKTGISSSDLFNAVRRESRQHYNQTGTSAFVY